MDPAPMAGLRRAAVLVASLALLGVGVVPAAAAEPAPDLLLPQATSAPDPDASEWPAALRADAPAGLPGDRLPEPDASVQRFAADGAQQAEAGTASISGTITYWKDGAPSGPLTTGYAIAYLWNESHDSYTAARYGYADDQGRYELADLAAGDYFLYFLDEAVDSPLIPEFSQDAPYPELATVVSLADGQAVTGVDEQLEPLLKGRIAGADRFETAVLASQAGFAADVPCVFIANGFTFPDALSAGPAAAHCGGPLLLVPGTWVPQVVLDEIARLSPERIVIAGGPNAVSADVESTLRAMAPQFRRYAGVDRYDTSRQIVAGEFGTAEAAWIATGANFPDALSASAAAAAADIPVLIVPGYAAGLDAPSAQALTALGAGYIPVAGGPNAVSWDVLYDIWELPGEPWAFRIGGETRYDTAAMIMDLVWDDGWAAYAFFASGTNFPDALAGAALAGLVGAPLYVTPGECTSAEVQAQVKELFVSEAYVLGYYQPQLYYDGWKPFRTC